MDKGPLHWSERAKMYPASFKVAGTPSPQPDRSRRDKQPRGGTPRKTSSRKGLWIAILVVLVCAAAAAAVFFWYLPSRDSSGVDPELEARSLVRQAMLTIDEAYRGAGTYEPQTMDPASLTSITPDMTFSPVSDTSAATSPTASAKNNAVDYAGTRTSYAVGTLSVNGTAYGVLVDTTDVYAVTYYLNGQPVDSWETPAPADTTTTSEGQTTDTDTDDTTTNTSSPATEQTPPDYTTKDVEALILLRDSMAAIDSAYAELGTFDPSRLTPTLLQEMSPALTFVLRDTDQAATQPVSTQADESLDFYGTATSYALGVNSESGASFGVIVEKTSSSGGVTYYVNGEVDDWSQQLPAQVVGHLRHQAQS